MGDQKLLMSQKGIPVYTLDVEKTKRGNDKKT